MAPGNPKFDGVVAELGEQGLKITVHSASNETWYAKRSDGVVAELGEQGLKITVHSASNETWYARRSDHMPLRRLHDRLLIERIAEQETVKGGIVISDVVREKSKEGEVVAFEAGKILENGSILPLELKEGDRILFGKYSGTTVRVADQDYLILREDEIVGILTQTGKASGKK